MKTPELVGMSMTVFIVIFFVGGSFLTVNTNFNWFNPEPLAKGCAEGTFYHSNPPSCQQFPPKIPEGEVLTIKFDHYEGWIELCYENRVCVWTGGLEARQINEMLFEIEESNSRLSTFLLTFLEKHPIGSDISRTTIHPLGELVWEKATNKTINDEMEKHLDMKVKN